MTLKEFRIESDILYSLKVFVNDEETITIEAYSEESLLEQLAKADYAINAKLLEQYNTEEE